MTKKLTIPIIIILIIAVWFALRSSTTDVVGETILASTFTNTGQPTGKTLLQVPFLKTLDAATNISIAIDNDGDGQFSDDEYVIVDFPVRPQADWRGGYYVTLGSPLTNGMKSQVTVEGKDYDTTIEIKTVEVGETFDLATVTDPENATKGWGIAEAEAQASAAPVEVTIDGVPDLTQRKGECAPTAAANSLISLVDRFGGEDLISGDPQDFISNLKRHMNWTPENGVPPDDFVAGKNRWAAAAGVPIRTTKVGDTHGISTIDAIREALESGNSSVELRIKFADANLNLKGGHMVTVTGIHQADGQTYLDINDPATPDSGTETVEIRSNQMTNYGPWEGITTLSWGFVQTWEGHPTGELLDTMTDDEIQGIREFVGEEVTIKVIEYNGKYLPVSQLKVEDEEGCGDAHWHAVTGVVTATDGTQVPDPGPQCGYGKVKDRPSMDINRELGQ